MIASLFGKAKQAPAPGDGIKSMRDTLDQLEKREKYLTKKSEAELNGIKKLQGKDRRKAIKALKRKKLIDGQISKLAAAKENIERILLAIEEASTNQLALNAFQVGTQAIKQMTQGMSIAQVDEVMEDMDDQLQTVSEISDALSRQVGDVMDDDDLDKELDEIERENLVVVAEAPPPVGRVHDLPSVPSRPIPKAASSVAVPETLSGEQGQFAELQAMMN